MAMRRVPRARGHAAANANVRLKKKAGASRLRPKLNREASRLGDVRIRRPSSRVLQPGNLSSADQRDGGKLVLRCKIAPSKNGVRGEFDPFLISRVTSAKSAILWARV